MNATAVQFMPTPPVGALLQARLVEFVHLAREYGFHTGVAEAIDAQRVACFYGIMQPQHLYWGLRSLFCMDRDDWQRFDDLFDAYWRSTNMEIRYQSTPGAPVNKQSEGTGDGKGQQTIDVDQAQPGEGEEVNPGGTRKGASRQEALAQTDFRFITDAGQMRVLERLAERLALKMRHRLVRRQKVEKHGRRIHMRRTLRNSLRYGGVPLQLAFRQRCKRQPRVILITDVSRSMSLYSYIFLRFARGIVNAFKDVDVFAYHTRLVYITDALRQSDLSRVRHSLALISVGWAGGTRIGESMECFYKDYSRLLNSRALVIIVSDGLDTGEPELLARQMQAIRRRCRKIIWLNPLLGIEGYEPRTGGMLAALPFVDVFAPAHNLRSLLALEDVLTYL